VVDAPAAQARIEGRGGWAAFQAALAAAGAACVALWAASRFALSPWIATGVVIAAAVFTAAWTIRRERPPAGWLRWDGATWTVEIDGAAPRPGTPLPTIDLGRWMLVRFTPVAVDGQASPRALWLPIGRSIGGSTAARDWNALRAALFARGRGAAPRGVVV
jgi:hypothetical protein